MKLNHARGTATHRDRSTLLRRNQEAAPKLRTMFPMVERLHFDLQFEDGGTSALRSGYKR